MPIKCLIIVILTILSASVPAQDFDEYKKQKQEAFTKLKQEQVDKISELRNSYNEYVMKRNEEFAKFVENSWKTFNAVKGEEFPDFPKPDLIPVYKEKNKQTVPTKIKAISKPELIKKTPWGDEVLRIPKIKVPQAENLTAVNFKFYNQEINMMANPALKSIKTSEITKDNAVEVLRIISENDYNHLLDQLYSYKESLNLNDWGFLQLTDSLSQQLAHNKTGLSNMITWALMNYAGYKVKIGIDENSSYLMIAPLQQLYGMFKIDDVAEDYYILDFEGGKITTHENNFEGAIRNLDFSVTKPLNFEGNNINNWYEPDTAGALHVQVNRDVIDFFSSYPLVDFSVYFNAPMSPITRNSLFKQLLPEMEGKSDQQKIEFLLNYVQNNFKYLADRDQFKREKFFFPEELFYYPYSDCEDRSALFIYLVKYLAKKEVIGLHYYDHMATAVALFDEPKGEYLEYNNKFFTICDPTFQNAPVGMGMPEYKKHNPRIIPVGSIFLEEEIIAGHWENLISAGARKSSMQNSFIDKNGNCYLTGTYKDKLTLSDTTIYTGKNSINVFIVGFSSTGEMAWLKNISNDHFNFSNGITGRNNHVYVGINSMNAKNNRMQLICNAYTIDGTTVWTATSAVDSAFLNKKIIKSFTFRHDGTLISDKIIFPGNQIMNSGLYCNDNGLTAYINFDNSAEVKKEDITVSSYSEYNVLDTLKKEYNIFLQDKCERYTAAVMAVLYVMKKNGMKLSGAEISGILEKNNPRIAENNPELIENLKGVKYFVNENGRIILRTNKGKRVTFFQMHFSDNAAIVINDINQQKTKIECLSGVQVGNRFIKFPLNFIAVDLPKGNFLFDYGSDHSKSNVNLRDDILKI